ncbi:MAG: DUF2752 domain-containing protein, partial [Ferruginibacter sp.]
NLELCCWVTGLFLLATMNIEEAHFSFCIFSWLGFTHCPGCGLGHAIHYILQGNLNASLNAHPFGIPALLILLHRVVTLAKPGKIFYLLAK